MAVLLGVSVAGSAARAQVLEGPILLDPRWAEDEMFPRSPWDEPVESGPFVPDGAVQIAFVGYVSNQSMEVLDSRWYIDELDVDACGTVVQFWASDAGVTGGEVPPGATLLSEIDGMRDGGMFFTPPVTPEDRGLIMAFDSSASECATGLFSTCSPADCVGPFSGLKVTASEIRVPLPAPYEPPATGTVVEELAASGLSTIGEYVEGYDELFYINQPGALAISVHLGRFDVEPCYGQLGFLRMEPDFRLTPLAVFQLGQDLEGEWLPEFEGDNLVMFVGRANPECDGDPEFGCARAPACGELLDGVEVDALRVRREGTQEEEPLITRHVATPDLHSELPYACGAPESFTYEYPEARELALHFLVWDVEPCLGSVEIGTIRNGALVPLDILHAGDGPAPFWTPSYAADNLVVDFVRGDVLCGQGAQLGCNDEPGCCSGEYDGFFVDQARVTVPDPAAEVATMRESIHLDPMETRGEAPFVFDEAIGVERWGAARIRFDVEVEEAMECSGTVVIHDDEGTIFDTFPIGELAGVVETPWYSSDTLRVRMEGMGQACAASSAPPGPVALTKAEIRREGAKACVDIGREQIRQGRRVMWALATTARCMREVAEVVPVRPRATPDLSLEMCDDLELVLNGFSTYVPSIDEATATCEQGVALLCADEVAPCRLRVTNAEAEYDMLRPGEEVVAEMVEIRAMRGGEVRLDGGLFDESGELVQGWFRELELMEADNPSGVQRMVLKAVPNNATSCASPEAQEQALAETFCADSGTGVLRTGSGLDLVINLCAQVEVGGVTVLDCQRRRVGGRAGLQVSGSMWERGTLGERVLENPFCEVRQQAVVPVGCDFAAGPGGMFEDSDGDGLTDVAEVCWEGTDPEEADSDRGRTMFWRGDGALDGWEVCGYEVDEEVGEDVDGDGVEGGPLVDIEANWFLGGPLVRDVLVEMDFVAEGPPLVAADGVTPNAGFRTDFTAVIDVMLSPGAGNEPIAFDILADTGAPGTGATAPVVNDPWAAGLRYEFPRRGLWFYQRVDGGCACTFMVHACPDAAGFDPTDIAGMVGAPWRDGVAICTDEEIDEGQRDDRCDAMLPLVRSQDESAGCTLDPIPVRGSLSWRRDPQGNCTCQRAATTDEGVPIRELMPCGASSRADATTTTTVGLGCTPDPSMGSCPSASANIGTDWQECGLATMREYWEVFGDLDWRAKGLALYSYVILGSLGSVTSTLADPDDVIFGSNAWAPFDRTDGSSSGAVRMNAGTVAAPDDYTVVHEFGHGLGLEHGPARRGEEDFCVLGDFCVYEADDDETGTPSARREFDELHNSIMSYAWQHTLSAGWPRPRWSNGSRSPVSDFAVTEENFSNDTDQFSGLPADLWIDYAWNEPDWQTDPCRRGLGGAPDVCNTFVNCLDPDAYCPAGYVCLPSRNFGANETYLPRSLGAPALASTNCYRMSPDRDWDGDGFIEAGTVTSYDSWNGRDQQIDFSGFSFDGDCQWTLNGGNRDLRSWMLQSFGDCTLVSAGDTCAAAADCDATEICLDSRCTVAPSTNEQYDQNVHFRMCASFDAPRMAFGDLTASEFRWSRREGSTTTTSNGTSVIRYRVDVPGEDDPACVWVRSGGEYWNAISHRDFDEFAALEFPALSAPDFLRDAVLLPSYSGWPPGRADQAFAEGGGECDAGTEP